MAETNEEQQGDAREDARDASGTSEEHGLEAEAESAAAMDADVPQPPQTDETTEGQPS